MRGIFPVHLRWYHLVAFSSNPETIGLKSWPTRTKPLVRRRLPRGKPGKFSNGWFVPRTPSIPARNTADGPAPKSLLFPSDPWIHDKRDYWEGPKMCECKTYARLRVTPIKLSSRSVEGLKPYPRSGEGCRDLYLGNLNMSKRSSMAGLLSGAYGLPGRATGFGKLSRLRAVNGFKPQFRSMNFRIET